MTRWTDDGGPRDRAGFLERLQEGVLVADGAMGTQIYERGVFINRCFDELCLSSPAMIREIHASYVEAGAELLETNTFGANRARLLGHGLEDRVVEINRAAVALAREAAAGKAWVGGSMGPIGVAGQVAGGYTPGDMRGIFAEQAGALLESGVDALVVETIPSLIEMEAALAAIRDLDPDVPVVAMMSFTEEGLTQSGEPPELVVARLAEAGADVAGANCSVGPRPMLDCVARMRDGVRIALAAMPNAGLPQSVEGRLIYMAGPEYFGKYAKRFVQAGVRLLGGCCGTTPDHVRAMALAVRRYAPRPRPPVVEPGETAPPEPAAPRTAIRPTSLAQRFAERRFVVSIELTPPTSADLDPVVEAVRGILEAGVDVVNIPEYARISPRVTPIAIARVLRESLAVETIVHYCCRDRNLYGMQADLMAAHALDVRDVLVITGDPPKAGGYAVPTAVFDVDSIGLVGVIDRLNLGLDAAGKPTGVPLDLHVGVGVNPGAVDRALELERFRRKVEAGARYAMSQPVFDAGELARFLADLGAPSVPVLAGILPLHSYRNAEFLHNEVPGMRIPEEIRERMRRVPGRRAAAAEGVRIAREALAAVLEVEGVHGAYLMPPFGRYEMALEVLDGLVPVG
ncbi:MAG TPA: bifunctional homocysteine S-methyltransferase/methylenetetrahydrofolate reductase [Gemmatimonadota bacterium]|nr:bifunctional homocysteine S-methyltransferase/methylenetetrahydrofolate reductase [Gemmatimonadota bacterium]